MGLCCCSVGVNVLENKQEIKEVLEREFNIGSIQYYGRHCIYKHL